MADGPGVPGGDEILHNGGRMEGHIILVQKSLLAGCRLSFLLENFQKSSQGLDDVIVICCFHPRDIVGVNYAFPVEIVQQHLLLQARNDLRLDGPRLTLLNHYFDCCFVSGVWKDTAD